jgi:HKD family nuclease
MKNSSSNMKFLLNVEDDHCHAATLKSHLRLAERLDCMVAFAKSSGLKMILDDMEAALEKGLEARFVVGLDFYQTDPDVLKKLFVLSNKYKLSLFISNLEANSNFHPKVYAFQYKNRSHIVIGSANLTGGGLLNNHEASILINDTSNKLLSSIGRQIDQLIAWEEVVPADKALIDSYEKRHAIYKVQQGLINRRANRAAHRTGVDFETLHDILAEMKADKSEKGFILENRRRLSSREEAKVQMNRIIEKTNINENSFIELYEPLVSGLWHSGGLQRGKNIIAEHAEEFQLGLNAITRLVNPSVNQAYQTLHDSFKNVPRAGINVISEILHTIDNEKFAVMNQNSVSGMSLANIYGFPPKPNKGLVNAELYEEFCEKAQEVCIALGLLNFTELDALFNYAYWD